MDMGKIAIIGAGNFGSALAHILSIRSDIMGALWDSDSAKMQKPETLQSVLSGATVIFLCVPSWSLRSAGESIAPLLSPGATVISPTKGLEEKTNKTSDEVLTDIFADNATVALLHGPMLAAEMMEGLPSFATVASASQSTCTDLQELFARTTLTLEYSSDVHGVALAGVLKNIYSIGLGMTEAMRLGSNFRGWYVRAAVREMSKIIVACGGKPETAYTSAGIGDLVATGLSPTSRNCKVGHELVQSGECSTVSEGGESLPQMMQILQTASIVAPIATSIADIVAGRADASTLLKSVL
ncbi:MAG: hypothetical protein A3C02_01030 [Candidatus Andersenbacteria bacterium RIFCSPHIGHO2_02_FULL_45_11]|uniref:Glycerol-3-phosphate dehydrogenase n=1 Tax=Candidatus Andersenbacteria bacterium RIFCSPHIGHO2_12_FULL_45_11 TaxID=1797281 RepID=A0A1G1WZG5_9BACT|nr:MAG: hypothetical protein A2805_00475 [Candidatus Andersenbacteria bacterium RIFCSPHIGHO2_01_FULL_46_36]OGY33135.1 MAG: hypothetical protein A3D99_01600 [Candidatus Andersenbacteria bacterium RIFCSPHIGHO2_12_FULL_45_11]OGY33159.1 MAG: hypothetical protein A3C02_01030 [Candidatus Andersenbacteria bacterium RIFCSPHIGHO2_02_FULL_45_11]